MHRGEGIDLAQTCTLLRCLPHPRLLPLFRARVCVCVFWIIWLETSRLHSSVLPYWNYCSWISRYINISPIAGHWYFLQKCRTDLHVLLGGCRYGYPPEGSLLCVRIQFLQVRLQYLRKTTVACSSSHMEQSGFHWTDISSNLMGTFYRDLPTTFEFDENRTKITQLTRRPACTLRIVTALVPW